MDNHESDYECQAEIEHDATSQYELERVYPNLFE